MYCFLEQLIFIEENCKGVFLLFCFVLGFFFLFVYFRASD